MIVLNCSLVILNLLIDDLGDCLANVSERDMSGSGIGEIEECDKSGTEAEREVSKGEKDSLTGKEQIAVKDYSQSESVSDLWTGFVLFVIPNVDLHASCTTRQSMLVGHRGSPSVELLCSEIGVVRRRDPVVGKGMGTILILFWDGDLRSE